MLVHLSNIIFLITYFSFANSKDLGTISTLVNVREPNLIEVIQKKLEQMKSDGSLDKHQTEIQKRIVSRVETPKSVDGIYKTTVYSSKLYDPSVVMPQDIKDHQGKIIIKAGTKYNPLEDHNFGDSLIFIDGDDSEQVQWSLSQKGKKILVNGSPLQLMRDYKVQFYFDQGGSLTKKLGIVSVPSKVSQKGERLLIEMIPVSSKGNNQ